MTVQTTCPMCKTNCDVAVRQEGYIKWQKGELIQNAMPELDDDTRERLITGICPTCWEEVFNAQDGDG